MTWEAGPPWERGKEALTFHVPPLGPGEGPGACEDTMGITYCSLPPSLPSGPISYHWSKEQTVSTQDRARGSLWGPGDRKDTGPTLQGLRHNHTLTGQCNECQVKGNSGEGTVAVAGPGYGLQEWSAWELVRALWLCHLIPRHHLIKSTPLNPGSWLNPQPIPATGWESGGRGRTRGVRWQP